MALSVARRMAVTAIRASAHSRAAISPAVPLLTRSAAAMLHTSTTSAAAGGAGLSNVSSPMFCYQCEQTQDAKGCTTVGVCGKTPEVAHLQDATVHALKALSSAAHAARSVGVVSKEADRQLLHVMFATLTNVNFDAAYFTAAIPAVLAARDGLLAEYRKACASKGVTPAAVPLSDWSAGASKASMEAAGVAAGVLERRAVVGEEAAGLQELIVYGLKGAAAYACHALEVGVESEEVYARLHKHMDVLARNTSDLPTLVGEAMAVGETGVKVLAALDTAHVDHFGAPTPTPVNHAPTAGKAILISGHDLMDLEALLKQTEGTGINVYTHGEMLPAHGYPGLHKYKHLIGHYGGPWQLQKMDYASFPGPIVQSTNCLIEPRPSYKARLFTTNSTGWPGVTHIEGRNFAPVIAAAKAAEGFKVTKPAKNILTGFGHNAVLGVAPAVIEAVKSGALKRFVLIGGCDGSEMDRSYYTRLATHLPDESVILTLGCAKFRVIGKKEYGAVPGTGIPRVLDMGQCNDSYSAVVVATELAKAFKTDVNSLPLSIVLSWLEQKAAIVLLALLHLGVKNIRIGPELPAFITPKTLAFLVDNFNISQIKADAADGDVDAVMGKIKA